MLHFLCYAFKTYRKNPRFCGSDQSTILRIFSSDCLTRSTSCGILADLRCMVVFFFTLLFQIKVSVKLEVLAKVSEEAVKAAIIPSHQDASK